MVCSCLRQKVKTSLHNCPFPKSDDLKNDFSQVNIFQGYQLELPMHSAGLLYWLLFCSFKYWVNFEFPALRVSRERKDLGKSGLAVGGIRGKGGESFIDLINSSAWIWWRWFCIYEELVVWWLNTWILEPDRCSFPLASNVLQGMLPNLSDLCSPV